MAKKSRVEGLNELVAMRVLIGHWPEADYIMRGISVRYGEGTGAAVRSILERRREAFAKELKELERQYGGALGTGGVVEALTKDVTDRHDSRPGRSAGSTRGHSKAKSEGRHAG